MSTSLPKIDSAPTLLKGNDIDFSQFRFTKPLDRIAKLDAELEEQWAKEGEEPKWKKSKFPAKQLDPIYETRKQNCNFCLRRQLCSTRTPKSVRSV